MDFFGFHPIVHIFLLHDEGEFKEFYQIEGERRRRKRVGRVF
jgi:hypothetical protein